MSPDEDGEGRGHGLAMLRLEARRYKREMHQILMRRKCYEQQRSTESLSSEDSSRESNDKWRFSGTYSTSLATTGTPVLCNREDVPVTRLEQLAIVEEGTQTDILLKSEVQTETEKLQYDIKESLSVKESKTVPSAVNNVSVLNTCSQHCNEIKRTVPQEAACECLTEATVRANRDLLFTAKPKQSAVEGRVVIPDDTYFRDSRPFEMETMSQTITMATSPTKILNQDQKSTDPVQDFKSLVFPVPRHDSACSPIQNLHESEVRFTMLGDKGTEMFSWQQGRSTPERFLTIAPPPFSTPLAKPQPEVPYGSRKAQDTTSDSSAEIIGSKQIHNEWSGESAMAARLATKIKHALEAINKKADTRSTNCVLNLPSQAIQSTLACRLCYKGQYPEMNLLEKESELFGGRSSNNKEVSSRDSSLPETCLHATILPVSSGQHHTTCTPCNNANIYLQNVLAAQCANQNTSSKLSGTCFPREVSAPRAAQRTERKAEATRRANVKSCGDHHSSHQSNEKENSVKTKVHQSGTKHKIEKEWLLSNVQKLQNVAKTAKRLYTDLVDCAYDELRASKDCGKLVKQHDGEGARTASKLADSEFCPSSEIISAHRADVVSTDISQVCGRCHVCQPQICKEKPPGESQIDSCDEITIELSDVSPTNIMVSRNSYRERPSFNVGVSTPGELPCQRALSPNNRCGNIVKRHSALSKPNPRRARPTDPCNNHQTKKGLNKCLLDPNCDGPRDCCHMPTRGKCSRARTVSISSPNRSSNECLLDPWCDGPRDCCHMPTQVKRPGATSIYISPPKKSNKCLMDSCDGPRNSCHMATRAKSSRATTVCISPHKKDPNMCSFDRRCVGSRDCCHMPTNEKGTRASCESCGLGGSSRHKQNNGMKLGNKNPFGLSRCLIHRTRGVELLKGKSETSPYRTQFQNAGDKLTYGLHDENPSHNFLHERKHSCPTRRYKDISMHHKGSLDEISEVDIIREARDKRNLCMQNNLRNSSMKGKEIKIGTEGSKESAPVHHSSSERMDHNSPVKNSLKSFQECPQIGDVKNHSSWIETGDIKKETAFVGKEARQPTVRHKTDNSSVLAEAYTQTVQQQNPQSDNVDRAVAAAGLAKEIEMMIADQLGKSNCRIKESNYLTSQCKLPTNQKDSFGQTKLDVAVLAAANAVKKLKPLSLLSLVKQDERNQKATPRKGLTPQARLMAEDTIGSSFYDQMYKELEELSSKRIQLVRQERSHFLFESFFSHQDDRHGGCSIKVKSSYDLRNFANAGSKLEECRRSARMQRSEEFPRFWDETINLHTPRSKRQRSATSPSREHSFKLLRTSVGKAESQASRNKQDHHTTQCVSHNQEDQKPNKEFDKVRPENLSSEFSRRKKRFVFEQDVENFNRLSSAHFGPAIRSSISSTGKWKVAPREAQVNITTKRKVFSTRRIRPPTWVDRMSKAKNVFSSLIRPMLLARIGKERQLESNVCKRTLQPPLLMYGSSLTSKRFGKRILGRRVFHLTQPNPQKMHMKKSIASNQYDISTGRKIVQTEEEPGDLLRVSIEDQQHVRHVRPATKSLHENNIRFRRRLLINHDILPSAAANLGGNHVRIRGWNGDPLIRSDIPHKTADIIRYNRNGGLDIQARTRDSGGALKSSTSPSKGQMNIRHVTFAGMVVRNSPNEQLRKSSIAPLSIDSLVSSKKANIPQHSKAKRTLEKRRCYSATKVSPIQGKLHRYGGGGAKWKYHEGFWTEMFTAEADKVSLNNSLESLMAPATIAQSGTPIVELQTAQVIENDTFDKSGERSGTEDLLTNNSSLLVSRADEIVMTNSASEENSSEKIAQSFATTVAIRKGFDGHKSGAISKENGEPQNLDLFKSLGFFRLDGLGGDAIIDHHSAIAAKDFLSTSQMSEELERVDESSSDTKTTSISHGQAQFSIADRPDQPKRREPTVSSTEFPQSPLKTLDEVFLDSTESQSLVNMFDRLQEASSIHVKSHLGIKCLGTECITRQTLLNTSEHNNKGLLKELELERTLMDLALHTILDNDPLQHAGVPLNRKQPISLPISRRMAMRSDKQVEAVVLSHDMSQSPPSKALTYVDKATEQDIISHVDRATALDALSHVDRATELDKFSLFFKDQDSQTTNAELGVQNIQGVTSPALDQCSAKAHNMHVHHQGTECQFPWNIVGIHMPDTTTTILATSPSLPAAMPMLMPIFFQHSGMSILPMVFPATNFSTTSNMQVPPLSTVCGSFPVGVDQGTQATESHVQSNLEEIAAQVHHQVPNLQISSRDALGQLSTWKEESDSDWDEESKRSSSPSTPSTPLSSPHHKLSLRKAMQMYSDNSSLRETAFAKKDLQPLVPKLCQVSKNDCQQDLLNGVASPIKVVTEMNLEEFKAEESSLIAGSKEPRRGISWAKVKDMEETALTLLRVASIKTPSATSSSEYSHETSPEVFTSLSPGEVGIEENPVGRRRASNRFVDNSCTPQEHLDRLTHSRHWSWFCRGQTSLGEVYDPTCFLGPLSEGEIEAGVVPSLGELGQIQKEQKLPSHSALALQRQGPESGEIHIPLDASSPLKSPTDQIVSNIVINSC